MTLYLDTSSLVKLYISEAGSDRVRRLVGDATVVATSAVAYPEARAAFARLRREGVVTRSALTSVKRAIERQWSSYLSLEATDVLCRAAGELAETYSLRGFDSVHLASYAEILQRSAVSEVEFSSFDDRLNDAAQRLKRKLTRRHRR